VESQYVTSDTLPKAGTIPSPPLVPFAMSDEQSAFLALHARHLVTKWVWIFGGGTLRATADNGKGATISSLALADGRRGAVYRRREACDNNGERTMVR
jgi:hypothetical protein